MGSSNGETEPKKVTYQEAGPRLPTQTLLEIIPAESWADIGKSLGNPVVKLATPKGAKNLTEGTKKNELRVKGKSNPFVGQTNSGTPSDRVGQNVIGRSVFRVHKLEQSMIRHDSNLMPKRN